MHVYLHKTLTSSSLSYTHTHFFLLVFIRANNNEEKACQFKNKKKVEYSNS